MLLWGVSGAAWYLYHSPGNTWSPRDGEGLISPTGPVTDGDNAPFQTVLKVS